MRLAISFLLLCSSFLATGQSYIHKHQIAINISNISSNDGQILVKLYNSEETFKKEAFISKKAIISNKKATITIKHLDQGTYAFIIIHDKNGDEKFNRGFLGLFAEDAAYSNGAKKLLGQPKWKDACFEIKQHRIFNIEL